MKLISLNTEFAKKIFVIIILCASSIVPLSAFAEACTYREAIVAFNQGNATRGMALMKMAANDGDKRAQSYIASAQATHDKVAAEQKQLLIVANQ